MAWITIDMYHLECNQYILFAKFTAAWKWKLCIHTCEYPQKELWFMVSVNEIFILIDGEVEI